MCSIHFSLTLSGRTKDSKCQECFACCFVLTADVEGRTYVCTFAAVKQQQGKCIASTQDQIIISKNVIKVNQINNCHVSNLWFFIKNILTVLLLSVKKSKSGGLSSAAAAPDPPPPAAAVPPPPP